MKRVIILAAACCLSAATAFGSIDYPTIGFCTGSNVRLRDNPGTNYTNVISKANNGDEFIVLGERRVNGDTWYAVDHPAGQGTLWIFGKYLELYDGDKFGSPVFTMSMKIRQDYGIRPAKARELLGQPKRTQRERFFFDPAQKIITEETLAYDGLTLRYIDGMLHEVSVTKKGHAFGKLKVGESRQMVIDILGHPAQEDDHMLSYEVSHVETLTFRSKDDEIVAMTWEKALDG